MAQARKAKRAFDESFLKEQEEGLTKELEECFKLQREARKALRFVTCEPEDESDVSARNQQQQVSIKTLNDSAKNISLIQSALSKIKQGSYGECADCGKLISRKRLIANPHANRCIGCEKKREEK